MSRGLPGAWSSPDLVLRSGPGSDPRVCSGSRRSGALAILPVSPELLHLREGMTVLSWTLPVSLPPSSQAGHAGRWRGPSEPITGPCLLVSHWPEPRDGHSGVGAPPPWEGEPGGGAGASLSHDS